MINAREVHEEGSEARQRVLNAAEELFMRRGYNAIVLRDIADSLGIRQASLYYHFPEGKEQLYVAVAQQVFERHRDGVTAALARAQPRLRAQLEAVADWFATQPRMCLMGMIHADLPALSTAHAGSVEEAAYTAIFRPLVETFAGAMRRGEIVAHNPYLLAGAFLALMDGLTIGETRAGGPTRAENARELISVLLDGLTPRRSRNEGHAS
jgi:AcrR family transcriptional regulator